MRRCGLAGESVLLWLWTLREKKNIYIYMSVCVCVCVCVCMLSFHPVWKGLLAVF
jgi:hypothetical protein